MRSTRRSTIQFLRDDGVVVPLAPHCSRPTHAPTILVDDIPGLEDTAVSAVVTSTNALPILVERTMRWNAQGYGAHTEKAIAGASLNWFFAEGSQGFFDTYLLLVNPNADAERHDGEFPDRRQWRGDEDLHGAAQFALQCLRRQHSGAGQQVVRHQRRVHAARRGRAGDVFRHAALQRRARVGRRDAGRDHVVPRRGRDRRLFLDVHPRHEPECRAGHGDVALPARYGRPGLEDQDAFRPIRASR